ncbi:ankyrin repeat protein [Roseimicrobium gellanilyticum]|uniref:Ankyrin repeat protein n=1 Tax=Roseimicrobium gellanilyticum TaxID=748857 RepID=A0A366HSA4_9BACT|nr:L,D-transpeptidase family protein [Roseimicrobium gellanilyticum]RBP45804.1 ankyrin repeat protein [Roseimicrobium gellanilyticum]
MRSRLFTATPLTLFLALGMSEVSEVKGAGETPTSPVPKAEAVPEAVLQNSNPAGPPVVETRRAIVEVPQQDTSPTIYDAVVSGDAELVDKLLRTGTSGQMVTSSGDTPLCQALRAGRPDIAINLVLHGADPNTPGLGKHTPVALASLRRHPTLLQVLLEAGGDPNKAFGSPVSAEFLTLVPDGYLRSEMKREHRVTPLMAASARGDVEAVTLLLKHGADRGIATQPRYRYALNFAADRRYLYVMRLLLGRSPDTEPHILITINLRDQKAKLEVEGKLMLETKISTGRRGYETPAGRYVITNKYKDWTSTIYKVPMPYFLRLNCSAIGLHSGYVTGRPASHGCIRLPHEMAKKFFSMTTVGDEVIIEH